MSDDEDAVARDPNYNYNLEREDATLSEFITVLDDARLLALGDNLNPGAKWAGLDKIPVEKYITLALCGIQEGDEPAQFDLTFDDAHQEVFAHPEAKVMKDVDSALIFGAKFFYTDNYDIMTTFDPKFTLGGHLHCKVPFTVSDECNS